MERERAFDFALGQISQLIESLPSGDQVPSAVSLAQTTGVSRPIVLQALRRLRQSGRVEIGKGRAGTKIARISPAAKRRRLQWLNAERDQVIGAARLREALEAGVCAVLAQCGLPAPAARRARALLDEMAVLPEHAYARYRTLDAQFHFVLVDAVRSKILREVYASARAQVVPAFDVLSWPVGRRQQSTAQHRAMLEAIQRGDVRAACGVALKHSHQATELIENLKPGRTP